MDALQAKLDDANIKLERVTKASQFAKANYDLTLLPGRLATLLASVGIL